MVGDPVMTQLAICGGLPEYAGEWPHWPPLRTEAESALMEVYESRQWTITSSETLVEPAEPTVSEAAARCFEVPYVVPVSSGTVALTMCLAASATTNSSVVMPALGWAACPAAICAAQMTPVYADVDPQTLCMDPNAASDAIRSDTAAILLVHQNCAVADLDAFLRISKSKSVELVQDLSHAAGATWRGRKVGQLTRTAGLSTQQNKLLPSGEGGLILCHDEAQYRNFQQARACGRIVTKGTDGIYALESINSQTSGTFIMTEFQASILNVELSYLDAANTVRQESAQYLRGRLSQLAPAVTVLGNTDDVASPTYHKFTLRLDLDHFADQPVERIAAALSAELGCEVGTLDPLLAGHSIYGDDHTEEEQADMFPNARDAIRTCIFIRHHILLAQRRHLDHVANAVAKVLEQAGQIPRVQ